MDDPRPDREPTPAQAGAKATDTGAKATQTGAKATQTGADATHTVAHATDAGAHATDTGAHATDTGAHATDTGAHATDTGARATHEGGGGIHPEPVPDDPRTEHPSQRGTEREGERDELFARVAAGLAHEIKNPLSTMAINLALLEEEWEGARGRDRGTAEPSAREKRCLKRVQTLKREVGHLETIVDDFLRYARGGVIDRAPRDLCQLVREVLDFVEPEDALAGIRHHAELPVGLPLVMLDPLAFRQAVLNLFVNARQAMPMGGELIVRVRRQGNFVELSVTDTGVGMTAEDLERCFEIYFSTKKEGTGLGLSTARRIVEEHGGTIHVISETGRGTSFSVLLPLLVEIHHTRPPSAGEEDSGDAGKGRASKA